MGGGGKRERGEVVSSRCSAFEIINANSCLSTSKPQIFYSNHTNELSIFHLCKIFAIVCEGNPQRPLHSFLRNGRKNSKNARTLLERIHVSNVHLRKLYIFPVSRIAPQSRKCCKIQQIDRDIALLPYSDPLIVRNLIRNAFTSQSRSKRRRGTESLDVSGSTDRNEGHVRSDTSCLRHRILGRNFYGPIPGKSARRHINHGPGFAVMVLEVQITRNRLMSRDA